MKKRILATLLALVMAVGLLPTAALAAGDFQITDGVLTEYTGPGGDVVIPGSVTAIGQRAFEGSSVTSVTIPSSVTTIGYGAFEYCRNLTSVTIPNSVTALGNQVFLYCESLTSVTIPNSVTTIGEETFRDCTSLTKVTIPNSVTSIGEGAFNGCSNLTAVTIANGVTSIGNAAFSYCESLTAVTIPDGVTGIGDNIFYGCTSLTAVTIPAGVRGIGNDAFKGCDSLTVRGAEGSYAQIWALDNGKTFEAVLPASATPGMTAYASTQLVEVDGKKVEFQCYALKDANGNDTNYVKLRDVAYILNGTAAQFQVGWDGQVAITTKTAYTPNGSEMKTPYSGDRTYAKAGSEYVKLNGGSKSMNALILKDAEGNGYTYFKLRDLGAALGFKVDWTAQRGIFIETK